MVCLLQKCGLLWCFISCLDSHSDGTHSLLKKPHQNKHLWMLFRTRKNSYSFLYEKQSRLYYLIRKRPLCCIFIITLPKIATGQELFKKRSLNNAHRVIIKLNYSIRFPRALTDCCHWQEIWKLHSGTEIAPSPSVDLLNTDPLGPCDGTDFQPCHSLHPFSTH